MLLEVQRRLTREDGKDGKAKAKEGGDDIGVDADFQRSWIADECTPPKQAASDGGDTDADAGLWADRGSLASDPSLRKLLEFELPAWPAAAERLVSQLQAELEADRRQIRTLTGTKQQMTTATAGLGGLTVLLLGLLLCRRGRSGSGAGSGGLRTVRHAAVEEEAGYDVRTEAGGATNGMAKNGFEELESLPSQDMKLEASS